MLVFRQTLIQAMYMLLVLLVPLSLWAAADHSNAVQEIGKALDRIEKQLEKSLDSESTLETLSGELLAQKLKLSEQLRDANDSAEKAKQQLASLGTVAIDESKDVSVARKSLEKTQEALVQLVGQYRLLALRAENMSQVVTDRINQLLTQRMLSRGPYYTQLLMEDIADAQTNALVLALQYIATNSGVDHIEPWQYLWLFLGLVVTGLLGYWIRRKLQAIMQQRKGREGLYVEIVNALIVGSIKYVTVFMMAAFFAVFNYIQFSSQQQVPFISVLAYGLPISLLVVWLVKVAGYSGLIARLSSMEAMPAVKSIKRRSYTLVVILFLTYLWLFTLHSQNAPERTILMVRDSFAIIMIVNIIWMIYAFQFFNFMQRRPAIKLFVSGFLAALLLLELSGFRNLALSSFRILWSITIAIAGFALLSRLFKEFFDALDAGQRPWHQPIRVALGLRQKQRIPGLNLIRVAVHAGLWMVFLVVVLLTLGVSDTVLQTLRVFIVEGITIGGLNIHPTRMLFAGLVFIALYLLSGWIKNGLNKNWFSKMNMERGTREALVTMTGYIGVTIAIVASLGIAGVTFTNLAIIAGALSVGIGFGLQNIVNNFVSGLILLFERPIKRGDWVVVGNTEGYVKKISIRSTQIQTFDRADVIVPNSDLISNQVTNWMLHDNSGRIRVPVGVAYGTDTQKVHDILTQIAQDDSNVISHDPELPTRVFFLAFGESSLDFELRCYIANIDERLKVLSALNFAIDKAFRENGIEIPFPQRDLHVKHMPAPIIPVQS